MTMNAPVFAVAAGVTLGLQCCGFLVAYALQTEVFYDILGGTNYLLLAFLGRYYHNNNNNITSNVSSTSSSRLIGMTILFVVSRGWLLTFLAWRAHKRKGDSRFDNVKDKFGLFFVFWLAQAFWVYLVSFPLLVVQSLEAEKEEADATDGKADDSLSTFDKVMLFGFAVGVTTEILGDIQKAQWVGKGRIGGFCRVGLWSYSRHPNYFGEIFQWWCAWLLSYGSLQDYYHLNSDSTTTSNFLPFALWLAGIVSPLFTMHVLLNLPATGVWNAEGKGLKRYYESDNSQAYTEYRASTSPLIPMVGYKNIPLWMKRQFLFEWNRFEYNPKKGE